MTPALPFEAWLISFLPMFVHEVSATACVQFVVVPSPHGTNVASLVTPKASMTVCPKTTNVVVVAVLLPTTGSRVVVAIVAESVIVPAVDGAVVVIVIAGAAPTASVGRVQVTVWPAAAQIQPLPVALTNATPTASV